MVHRQAGSVACFRCARIHAWRSPSRARYASAAVLLALMPDERRDLLRRHALDLAVPEHLLPAGRQRPERLRGRRTVEGVEGRRLAGVGVLERLERLEVGLVAGPPPARRGVADRREQVRAERRRRPLAREDRVVDAGERLGDEVVGVERTVRARHGSTRRRVPLPQLRERRTITLARALDERRVGVVLGARRGHAGLLRCGSSGSNGLHLKRRVTAGIMTALGGFTYSSRNSAESRHGFGRGPSLS